MATGTAFAVRQTLVTTQTHSRAVGVHALSGRYMLSYIPYGQTMAKKILRKLLRRQGLIGPEDAHASTAVSPAAEG